MQRKIFHSLSLIAEAIDKHKENIGVACSFGKDSVVTTHLCRKIDPNIKVFTVITPYLPKETKIYRETIMRLWNITVHSFENPIVEGKALYLKDVEKCCDYYKVEPTRQAIKQLGLKCWITGLRRTEGTEHRKRFTNEIEERGGLAKINPILQWTEAEVWLYHAINSIPVHPLYLQGYRSLGCLPCSKPYTEEERSGRWEGTNKCECGIHQKSLT